MAAGGRVGANGALERRRLGRTDIVASVLGFGGSEIGYQGVSARTVARLLGGALDAGLNAIDTAECYEDSEILIGKAIGARRHELYLFTKCGHAGGWGRADWRRAPLLASIERSLRRLSTDYVDLIQLHSCSLDHLRKGEAIEALERARARGWSARGQGRCGRLAAAPVAAAPAGRPPRVRRSGGSRPPRGRAGGRPCPSGARPAPSGLAVPRRVGDLAPARRGTARPDGAG